MSTKAKEMDQSLAANPNGEWEEELELDMRVDLENTPASSQEEAMIILHKDEEDDGAEVNLDYNNF